MSNRELRYCREPQLAKGEGSSGVQEFRSSGVQEFRSSGVQEFRSSGVQEFRSSGVQEFRSSGVQEFRSSGVQGGETAQIARQKSRGSDEIPPVYSQFCLARSNLRLQNSRAPSPLTSTAVVPRRPLVHSQR